jgi:hypothetical protein
MGRQKTKAQHEARAQIELNAYLREKKMPGFFELKYTDTDSFSFAKIEIHQYEGLQATEKNGLVWKLSDDDRRQKPCDSLSIPPLPSYLVIKFTDTFYFIRIKWIVNFRELGLIGITRKEAEKYAEVVMHI